MRHTVFAALCLVSTGLLSIEARSPSPVLPKGLRFDDITKQAGISFHHENGARGRRYMVEIAGGGVLAFDYDLDGRTDLYFLNGASLTDAGAASTVDATKEETHVDSSNRLYRNLGGGRFGDVTQDAGVGAPGYSMGGAAADIDNDGDPDLFVTAFGINRFFLNNGDGSFTETTDHAGIGDSRWATSAAFFDADIDGYLDLYVVNYLSFTLDSHRECVSPTKKIPSYCHPQEYEGVMDVFYRNTGLGSFSDLTIPSGIAASSGGKGLGVSPTDYDDDGDIDLYVANDTTANFLFENDGSGEFIEVGLEAGVAYNEEGLPEAGMGTDWGDVDRDGRLDLVVTNFDFETNTLYQNLGGGLFFDATVAVGLGAESLTELGFGCELADFNNDGWLDFIVTNGHILDNIAEIQSNLTFEQPAQFFANHEGRFENISKDAGSALSRPRVGRALAALDLGRDGDLDLVLANNGGRAELLRNELQVTADGASSNTWVQLRLIGVESNRDALGARIQARMSDGRLSVEELRAGSSYLAQSELIVHLGLDGASRLPTLTIRWPSGNELELEELMANRRYVLKEGIGILASHP